MRIRKLTLGMSVLGLLLSASAFAARKPVSTPSSTQRVLEHHGDLAHSGHYIASSLSRQNIPALKMDSHFKGEIQGPSYSQPLYVDRGQTRENDLVLVTTEANQVYAFDASTGIVVWTRKVGEPVPRAALSCGNIDPLGITGTPVISLARQALYFDAMTTPDAGKTKHHQIFALSLKDGSVLPGFPVDVADALKAQGVTFNAEFQNQRSALTILGERVYVAFGGHYGDCGDYHGWVVSLPLSGGASGVRSWQTSAPEGGIWAPGGIVSDGASIYFATGNTDEAETWSGGEAIIRLGPDLKNRGTPDYFAPQNWKQLDDEDTDIGGTAPVLVELPGATPSKLVIAMGKNGIMYLIDRENLGGIGHELFSQKVSSPMITAPAVYSTASGTYIVFKGRGVGCPAGQHGDLTAVKLLPGAPPKISVAWCASQNGTGSPIVTTVDGSSESVVWGVGAEGDNRLHAFNAETGKELFASVKPGDPGGPPEGSVSRFQSPIVAKGQMYLIVGDRLCRFSL